MRTDFEIFEEIYQALEVPQHVLPRHRMANVLIKRSLCDCHFEQLLLDFDGNLHRKGSRNILSKFAFAHYL